jgi:cytochrome c-type biogenesis protein CcmH/NrfG
VKRSHAALTVLFLTSLLPSVGLAAKNAAPGKPEPSATVLPAGADTVSMLRSLVAKDTTKFENLYRLGVAYLDKDSIPEAIRTLEMANRRRPKDVKTLVNLGAAYDAAGRTGDAQTSYRDALKIAPEDSVASCRLASSLYSQARYPECMTMLRDIIQKKPGSYCAYFTLGVAFADAGIYRDAIRAWKKVVELAPASPEASSAKESIDILSKFVKD